MSETRGFETLQIHAGQTADPTTGARAVPIYQTTAYQFRSTEHAANLFALAEVGNIYTRIMNPTQGVFEARVAALEGAPDTAIGLPGALAVGSGQAAETIAILNLAEAGSHIVASSALYGGTYNLLHYTLPKLGIETTFVHDPDDLAEWAAAVRPNTKAFYGETIGNPRNDVLDIEGVSGVEKCRVRRSGLGLMMDSHVEVDGDMTVTESHRIAHLVRDALVGSGLSIADVVVHIEPTQSVPSDYPPTAP